MKDVNELSKLMADMALNSLIEIINANTTAEAVAEKCETDLDYRETLFNVLREKFSNLFTSGEVTHESVVKFLSNNELHTREIMDIIDEAGIKDNVSSELEDEIVDNWIKNIISVDELIDKCPSSLDDDLRDYYAQGLEDDFKDRAKDAIDNM